MAKEDNSAPATPARTPQQETEYVILKAEPVTMPNGGMSASLVGYVEVGREKARKWDAAIEKFIEIPDGTVKEGAWKAVPVRNWPSDDLLSTNEQKTVPNISRGKSTVADAVEAQKIEEPVRLVDTPTREGEPVG